MIQPLPAHLRLTALFVLVTSCAAPLAAQEVTLRSGASEVLVDVVVRDKHGKLVHGLKLSDFAVSEDGGAQAVTSWREVRGTVQEEATAPAAAPAKDVFVQGHAEAKASVYLPRQIRLVSLVFDKLGVDGRKLSRKAALDFVTRDLGPNVFYAVFRIDRDFRVLQTYTNNAALLRKAIERATGGTNTVPNAEDAGLAALNQQTSGSIGAADNAAAQGLNGGTVSGGSLSDEQANAFTDQMLQLSDRLNRTDLGQVSIFSLWAIVKQLERLPGRKSVLYFSDGYTLPNELWMQFASLISAANRANVTVNAIDARGVISASETSLAQQTLAKGIAMSNTMRRRGAESQSNVGTFRAADYQLDSLRASSQMVLRELAESTGGQLIANSNDVRPQLAQLSEDFNTWYELTYKTLNSAYDGRFRSIAVHVASHPDYAVQARSGYFALPPMEGELVFPFEVPLLRALGQSPLPHALEFLSSIIPYRHLASGQLQCALVFDLPLNDVEFTWDAQAQRSVTHLSVLALVKDEHGAVVAKLSRDVPLSEPKDRVDAFKRGRFIVTRSLDLAPGRYTIESVAADQRGDHFGARRSIFVADQAHAGPAMSELALLRRLEPAAAEPDLRDALQIPAGRVVPTLATDLTLQKDTVLSVFFKLYPATTAASAPPRLVIDLLRDGKLLTRSTPDLPAVNAQGEIPYLANVPVGALKPGEYEFRATYYQGKAGDQRTIAVTLQ